MSGLRESEIKAALQAMDKDREIETLRARIAELEQENERLEMAYGAAGESATHEHERADTAETRYRELVEGLEGCQRYSIEDGKIKPIAVDRSDPIFTSKRNVMVYSDDIERIISK